MAGTRPFAVRQLLAGVSAKADTYNSIPAERMIACQSTGCAAAKSANNRMVPRTPDPIITTAMVGEQESQFFCRF